MPILNERTDPSKDQSVRWINNQLIDDKSNDYLHNVTTAAQPFMFGNINNSLLLGRTMPLTGSTTKPVSSPSPGQNAASLLLQQNPRRYTPY
ncbi:unnamed protein product [Anisakis simplex]|uniref:Transcription factor n=1 Tax=Anisakis simplex TaxID=6269 RepID=A0A0M3JCQ4_ANISI|nr:unnamed protein product [Anisakis simplex]